MGKLNSPHISLDHLKYQLLKPDPNSITNYVLENKISFGRILQMDLRSGGLIIVLKILRHVSNSEFERSASEIFQITFTETFLQSIRNYLSNFCDTLSKNRGEEDLNLVVSYIDVAMNELPLQSQYYTLYISLLEEVLKTVNNAGFGQLPLRFWANDLILLLENKALHLNRQNSLYRDLNDYPSPVDFFEDRPLKSNAINHRYKSAEEYLDIQYKLLKEDYRKSVRDGMKQYKRECRGALKALNPNISVYEDVTVHAIEANKSPREGILHVILFSTEDEKRFKDEKCDKRFMNGQLLYFSSYSQFTTFIIATVVDGNFVVNDKKERKAIRISVVGDPLQLRVKQQYVLAEPKAFFEPYYQVLKALKFIEPSELPMAKYVLNLDLNARLPEYLPTQYANIFLNHFDNNVSPLVELNESQLRALKTALTNEFTLIQGPPGTGKTHLVKAIIKVLIEFKDCRSAPIFVVCSRNSSLDLVMGPLAQSGLKVIRLGSQTKSDILKECTIQKLKTKSQNKWSTFNSIKALKNKLLSEKGENPDYFTVLFDLHKEISMYIKLCESEDADLIGSSEIDVIGATTTGAARLHYLMSLLQPQVVIVEEAAEVFESHILASIPQGCKHVILVGDHKQLQPNPAHLSSLKHNMHVSLFERLLANGMHFCTLTEQHRMRPEIASLICPLIYGTLINHESVCSYPAIKGVAKNVFFIDHSFTEEEITETGSRWNKHEGQVLLALADYLVKQGYSPKDISLLSPYTGQVAYLFEAASNYSSLKEMKISSVDNYQGEENLIVLLSLVRSQTRTIGFLESSNRVNVALSRAKHGLFIIGNMSDLSSHTPVWQKLKQTFEQRRIIDRNLPLKCQTHGTITKIKMKRDIVKLKYGGCTKPCGRKLKCGHLCKLICHPPLKEHECETPEKRCQRIICNLHQTKCNRNCFEDCEKCTEIVFKKLDCGHEIKIQCYEGNGTSVIKTCEMQVPKMVSCGHFTQIPCYLKEQVLNQTCVNTCNKIVCNLHQTKCDKKCFEDCRKCTEIVQQKLVCGHNIKIMCHERNKTRISTCEIQVSKMLSCGHFTQVPCYLKGQALKQICENPCNKIICNLHQTKCDKKCFEDCGKCTEIVHQKLVCGHNIKIMCHERNETRISTCEIQVSKMLSCGHFTQVPCYLKGQALKQICENPCNKIVCDLHPTKCDRKCFEDCRKCPEIIHKKLICGHDIKINCHERSETRISTCEIQVSKMLSCGHFTQVPCYLEGQALKQICKNTCNKIICNLHRTNCDRKCFEDCRKCTEIIHKKLVCGHGTKIKCHERNETRISTCEIQVSKMLSCGHFTQIPCYLKGQALKQMCENTCNKIVCNLHQVKCTKNCFEDCGKCTKPFLKNLDCGHFIKVKCHERNATKEINVCEIPVPKKSSCGHIIQVPCYLKGQPLKQMCMKFCNKVICSLHGSVCGLKCFEECRRCTALVTKELLCGHRIEVSCCERKNAVDCEENIVKTLPCGHTQTALCSSQLKEMPCDQPCNRLCRRGHKCRKACSAPCGPCMAPIKKYCFCWSVTVACHEMQLF